MSLCYVEGVRLALPGTEHTSSPVHSPVHGPVQSSRFTETRVIWSTVEGLLQLLQVGF